MRALLRRTLSLMFLFTLLASFAGADVVKDLRRKFPANFCPLGDADATTEQDFHVEFTATGTTATLSFDAITGTQWVDSIAIVPLSVYLANLSPSSCYTSPGSFGASFFDRDNAVAADQAAIVFEDYFVGGAPGWTLSLASWDAAETSLEPNTVPPGVNGSLSFPAASASASISFSGMVPGQTYVVSGWWQRSDEDAADDLRVSVLFPAAPAAPNDIPALDSMGLLILLLSVSGVALFTLTRGR